MSTIVSKLDISSQSLAQTIQTCFVMVRYHLPKGMRYSTLSEKEMFYEDARAMYIWCGKNGKLKICLFM